MVAPQIFQLSVASAFDNLDRQQKLYAHYMFKAAWSGSRIIFRQVSPEANSIFDFIMALYRSCDGDWEHLARRENLDVCEVQPFLDYAVTFLSNMGNYYGSGDQKFTPDISKGKLARSAASAASRAATLWEQIKDPMFLIPLFGLGLP
ncbi:uncharacterized protein ATNIH1004_008012 [Aspergillus tanneri]|uniref:Uncharacterized protein n=1 Tax=Aspergillus tanneri TaxID=1220188 RepID=A0A5M9MPV0_9EURO|nr:uncharacterized protein ATNIH1004_008012 [Aspergillus tanneri]KAA8646579.1 hypothetical protein ATNIH1004_008012 [Aspergillus tanneri]